MKKTASLDNIESAGVAVQTTSRDVEHCVYKPAAASVELDVEAYSAMRYHGQ